MIFRRLDKGDISLLIDMRLKYIDETAPDILPDVRKAIGDSLPDYFERHIERDLFAFAAFDDGVIVSTAFLLIVEKPANPNFITGRTGTVLNVFTVRSHRRIGIAAKVVSMLLDHARSEKLDFVELQATRDGYPLYKKLGFSEKENSYTSMKYALR